MGLVLLLPVWFGLDGILYFMVIADVLTFAVSLSVILRTMRELNGDTAGKNEKKLDKRRQV